MCQWFGEVTYDLCQQFFTKAIFVNFNLLYIIICFHIIFMHTVGIVSIQQSLASSFFLRQYNNVTVNKVVKKEVTLDMLELIIKDTFLTRGDAWRLNREMIGSCVYINSKVDFCNTRVTINELWMKGEKVACGVVGKTTKVRTERT